MKPLMYVIKTYEYKSSLRKLTRKLSISFTNKNVRKKLKVLVVFLSNQNIGGRATRSPSPLLFFSKSFGQNYEKAI